MRRLIPSISFGKDPLAHIDALSLLHSIDIAGYKGLNFLVSIKLAMEFSKDARIQSGIIEGVYNSKDPEYRMVDKFVEFTLKNSGEIYKKLLESSLDNNKLSKEEILSLIKLGLVSKEAVKNNIVTNYVDGFQLTTDSDILKALKENKTLVKADFEELYQNNSISFTEFFKLFPRRGRFVPLFQLPLPRRGRFVPLLQLPSLREVYRDLNISKEEEAVMTGILEVEYIMKASLDEEYFEEFLKKHGEENEIRRIGLLAITRAVREALNQTGVSLTKMICNALERAIGLHILWNMGYVEEVIGVEVESREHNTMVMLDYHQVSKEKLDEEVLEFGSGVRAVEEGEISMAVYITNEKPEREEGFNFENSGVSIGGNTLWIGENRGGMVIYAQGAEMKDIEEEISRNRKIKEKIKEKVETSVKGIKLKEIEIESIEVERSEEGERKGISYTDNGDIRVGYKLFKEKVERGEVLEFSGSLRAIKNAEGYTYARSIIHNLNDVEEKEGFIEYLKQHQKMGNGQIVIKESLVRKMEEEIKEERLERFINEARKDGVEVYVMLEEEGSKEKVKRYQMLGLAGYVYEKELKNFALGSSIKMEEIGKFNNEKELEDSLKESKGIVLINNTELKRVIEETRTGLGISRIISMLSSMKVIKIFKSRAISREYVEGVVRNIEIKDIPEVEENGMKRIKDMVRNKDLKNIENVKEVLGIEEKGSNVISVYIKKIERELEGREDKEEIMEVLVRAIVERVLVAEELRSKGKELGLRDKNHEIILGKALIARMERGIEYDNKEKREIEEFVKGLKTEIEVEVKLNKELPELVEMGIEGNEEEAVRKIIELIGEISEGKMKVEIREEIRPKMDIRNYKSILSAA
jgi:hypothetical protein